VSNTLLSTLGNPQWVAANAHAIKAMLPETWTHIANLNGLQIAFRMKVLGIDWRTEDEFAKCMLFFERAGLMKRDGVLVKRSL
jgi:hypothetical protein